MEELGQADPPRRLLRHRQVRGELQPGHGLARRRRGQRAEDERESEDLGPAALKEPHLVAETEVRETCRRKTSIYLRSSTKTCYG